MRNKALPGIKKLKKESPLKDHDPYKSHAHPHVPKPSKKVVEKKVTPPPKKGPTTYIPKKGGGQTALTEPN